MSQLALMLVAISWGTNPAATKPVPNAPKPLDLHPVEQNIVHYTNLQRKRHGLAPLRVDGRLMASARRHCMWMARNHVLQHTSLSVAENIAMGQRDSREAVNDWVTSPGHRANILHPGYRRIGVAAFTASDGTIYWCQQFQYGDPTEEASSEAGAENSAGTGGTLSSRTRTGEAEVGAESPASDGAAKGPQ